MIKDQDPHHSQIGNDETTVVQYPNENNSEDIETNLHSAIPKFMLQILKENEITGVNFSNEKGSFRCGPYLGQRLTKI